MLHAWAMYTGALSWRKIQVFGCLQVSSYLTNFIHKATQDFFVKSLFNCLSLRYELTMH